MVERIEIELLFAVAWGQCRVLVLGNVLYMRSTSRDFGAGFLFEERIA